MKKQKIKIAIFVIAVVVLLFVVSMEGRQIYIYNFSHQPYPESDKQFLVTEELWPSDGKEIYYFHEGRNLPSFYHNAWYDSKLGFYIGQIGAGQYILNKYGRQVSDFHHEYFKDEDGHIWGSTGAIKEKIW